MKHPHLPIVVELHITQIPRSVRCIVLSFSATDVWITTQGYADIQMLKQNHIHLNNMLSNTSVSRLIKGHQLFIQSFNACYVNTDHPHQLHEKMMNDMVWDLVVSGHLVRRGDTLAIPLRLIPCAILGTFSGWLK